MSAADDFDLTPYHLHGPWADAARAIIRMWTDGPDPRDLELPTGHGSGVGVERYAREYCLANPRFELGIIFGVASVGVCVAAQGGMVALCPLASGGWLEVPAIEGMLGVAPSGYRKSTALNVARVPLERALDAGVHARILEATRLGEQARTAGALALPAGKELDEKSFNSVFGAGICANTLVRDPTPEAVRNLAVESGGAAAVMAGEPEVLRNIGGYSKDNGTLGVFLEGWDQEAIEAIRVGQGSLRMKEAAIFMACLLQTEVFAEVTGGTGGNGQTGDSFVQRGVLGRWWVVRGTATGGFEALADEYADDNDIVNTGPDGYSREGEGITPLGHARVEYEDALRGLVRDTNRYRSVKGMRRAWEQELAAKGVGLQVQEILEEPRQVIEMDTSARLAWRRLQRLQLAVEAALWEHGDADTQTVFGPLAARITQHAMRAALVQTLGADMRGITGEAVQDAACRIVPWRIAHSTDALLQRSAEIAEVAVTKAATSNPQVADRGVHGHVTAALIRLSQEHPKERVTGFNKTAITKLILSGIPGPQRTGVARKVGTALAELVADPRSDVSYGTDGRDMLKRPVKQYVVSAIRMATV
jgi:hypothetical protein